MTGSPEGKSRLAQELIEAFNDGDWDSFRDRITSDVVYEEPGTGRRAVGPDQYMQLLQGWRQAFPNVSGEVRRTVASGDTVAVELVWRGDQTGDLETPSGTIPASGRQIETAATIWDVFEGDKLKEARHHLDIMTMLQQLGAGPTSS